MTPRISSLLVLAALGCGSATETSDASSDATSDAPGVDASADVEAAAPPPKLAMSGPIVIKNQSDAGFSGLHVVSDAGPCVRIEGSSHVVIAASEIGPCGGNGIELSKDDDVTIADSYIHPEHPASGCCDTGDGVYGNTITNVTLQGDVIAFGEANIEVTVAQHVHVLGNFMLNPQNAGSRGQNFQAWGQCADVHVEGNYTLSSTDAKYAYPEKQEDSINFGFTDGITATGNYVRGGHSPSGCGIIADEAANGPTFSNNVLVDTGQCGINISDGTNAIVDGNRIINSTPVQGGGNTGLVVWKEYPEACGPVTVSNNVSSELKPDMVTESGYWNGGGCDPVTLSGNTWDSAARAMLTPVDQKLPPPAIPPGPRACVAVAPWTNQTSMAPCWSM